MLIKVEIIKYIFLGLGIFFIMAVFLLFTFDFKKKHWNIKPILLLPSFGLASIPLIILGIAFLSFKKVIIVEAYSRPDFLYEKYVLVGNVEIEMISDEYINTKNLKESITNYQYYYLKKRDYKSIVVNKSEHELLLVQIIYVTEHSKDRSKIEVLKAIPKQSYTSAKKEIDYFFLNEPPDSVIYTERHLSEGRYWLTSSEFFNLLKNQ